jgi:DNA-binding Lrp family transcriptional regulator
VKHTLEEYRGAMKAGRRIEAIASELGVSTWTVRQRAKRLGIVLCPPRRPVMRVKPRRVTGRVKVGAGLVPVGVLCLRLMGGG